MDSSFLEVKTDDNKLLLLERCCTRQSPWTIRSRRWPGVPMAKCLLLEPSIRRFCAIRLAGQYRETNEHRMICDQHFMDFPMVHKWHAEGPMVPCVRQVVDRVLEWRNFERRIKENNQVSVQDLTIDNVVPDDLDFADSAPDVRPTTT